MGPTIRSKMILYTVLPVVVVYLVLYGLGVNHVERHLSRDAQALLLEHANHQASRLALLMSQAPALAEGLGDLVLADPGQTQALLYAHLIDGLRRTPSARTAAIAFGEPRRSALMRRGADSARPLRADEGLRRTPGWHVVADSIGFSRPIYRSGKRIGDTWVAVSTADVYAELDRQRATDIDLYVRHHSGHLLVPAIADPQITALVSSNPLNSAQGGVQSMRAARDGAEYWLINAAVPGHPWWITAVIPTERALVDVEREVVIFAAGLLVSLLLIVLIIGAVARQITRPLNVLDSAVQRITRGDFVVAPEVRSDDELGRLASAIGRMARHIADREYQLRSSHQVLEQRVTERTSALQEANQRLTTQIEETRKTQHALRLANEQAQQASRAKSEFLSNMSHELRTPLHGVLGYAQILRRETADDDSQHESLDAIERCGQHLLTLINDILDLTKIEAGEMRVEQQATNLPQLVGDVCTIVAQRAAQKGLALRSGLADDVPTTIRTDPLKLRQVLLNLLGNAVKFTTSGTVELNVRLTADERLAFEVLDSGVGIPADKIDAIFDAFQQARDGQAVDGTGLGLAISQRLIHLLGGDALRAESEPGHGSRFYFYLPCEALADQPAGPDTERADASAQQRALATGQTCRVLIADGSTESRNVLATLLRHVGCSVDSGETTSDAVALLADRHWDLVLFDMRGPDDDLAGVATALRRGNGSGAPALVAVSANAFPDTAEQARAAGFDGFLAKPFSEDQVLDLIEQLTGARFVEARRDATPTQQWPAELAGSTARHISKAIELGDIGSLFQLAEDLADEPGAPQTDVENLALMARMFDFDGLRALSERLAACA